MLLRQHHFYQETGIKPQSRYELDLRDVQEKKQQLQEFIFYRKKFEKSQRAKAELSGKNQGLKDLSNLDLNEDMFDP